MSKINKQKFAVLHDEVFTLDSLHHGAASQHIANVTIPYYKKVKFAGRLQQGSTDELSYHTNDEPMNMSSRPIILFLSYNQKISASVEGWTAISEC
jgi:flagellar basal body rod protein FlgB